MDTKQKYLWEDFDEYLKQGAPDKQTKAANWQTAMGLQAVDGLQPSEYLVDTARRNIEGEIELDEAQQLIVSYYVNKSKRDADDDNTEEADRASLNIAKILASRTIDFSTNGYANVHRRIFDGVFTFAGKMRTHDISKKEWVLRGDSVSYLNFQDLHRAVDYDLQQEREFNYKGLTMEEKVKRIAHFTAGLWQIHAFPEGNTRATAVFLIQYLRSIGFDVNNEMFARYSWYFRNALVRANYKNVRLDIDYDYSFLEAFFRNLLMGERNTLSNRQMLINAPDAISRNNDTDSNPNDTEKTVDDTEMTPNDTDIIRGGTIDRIAIILRCIAKDSKMSATTMAKLMDVSVATVKRDIAIMKQKGMIERVGSERGGHWMIKKLS